jgi:hypothetical protein
MIPAEIEMRYLQDPTAAFAVQVREQLVNELLPSIRISETLIGKFGGSSAHPLLRESKTITLCPCPALR